MARSAGLWTTARTYLTEPQRHPRRSLVIWGTLALVNMAVGVALASANSDSYREVRLWLDTWARGVDPYSVRGIGIDYPPYATVFFRPLAWLPHATAYFDFAVVNVPIWIAAAWLLVSAVSRLCGVRFTTIQCAAIAAALLAWSPIRVAIWNGQTTGLVMSVAFAAMYVRRRSPITASLLLGLALCKPHLALAFVALFIFERRFAVVAGALAIVGLATLGYAFSVGKSPLAIGAEYYTMLTGIYGGPNFLPAELGLREIFVDVLGDYGVAEPAFLFTSIGIGVLLTWLAWRARREQGAAAGVFVAFSLASVLVFPYRRYSLLMIAPAILLPLWLGTASGWVRSALAVMIVGLCIDVPFAIRHGLWAMGIVNTRQIEHWFHYANRVPIILLFLVSAARLARVTVETAAVEVAPSY